MKTTLIRYISVVCLFLPALFAGAQKLPSVQQISLRAPADIKVDGKTTEWNNKFQAYNKNTEFYYTISNDDNNLYLTVQSTIPEITNRINNGGISFIINALDKKDDKGAIGIQYPVIQGREKGMILLPVKTRKAVFRDAPDVNMDSMMNVRNNRITAYTNYIKTIGLKNLDTVISVYNEDGIKAACLFDNKLIYSWEASISLKNLGLNLDIAPKFTYHIKINAVTEQGINQPNQNSTDPLQRLRGITVSNNAIIGQDATDFWGEYTLAKKP